MQPLLAIIGILTRATEAKQITEKDSILEELKLGYVTCQIDQDYTKENFQKNVSGTIEFWNYKENEKNLLIYKTVEGVEYYVFLENGEIFFLDQEVNKIETSENTEWEYEEQEDGTLMITGYLGTNSKPLMPDIIDNKPVTKIEQTALMNGEFTEISLSKFLEEIGQKAFATCVNLKKNRLTRRNQKCRRKCIYKLSSFRRN